MTASLPESIRPDFPALQRTLAGRSIAFFDGPGGSQVPHQVAAAVSEYLTGHNANTHGAFATSHETDAILAGAREAMADFVGGRPDEIVFGANMTTLTFHLSRALGRAWGAGGEVVVTALDHQANVGPWRQMAADAGMTVREVPFDPHTLQLDLDALRAALSPRTRLVAVGAASNALGTINPVAEITALARQAGALSYVDAVHYAPHRRVDVAALGCDFLACSAYKFFGPHAGILWGRGELLAEFTPYRLPPASNLGPERWETGTQNHEGIAGIAAAVEWIAALGGSGEGGRKAALNRAFARIHAHESTLFARLEAGLREIPGVTFHGVAAGRERTPTAAFTVQGVTPQEVATRLAAEGVFVWNGDFYATTVCDTLGLSAGGGLVRAGLAPYNTGEDVERLLEGVRRLVG